MLPPFFWLEHKMHETQNAWIYANAMHVSMTWNGKHTPYSRNPHFFSIYFIFPWNQRHINWIIFPMLFMAIEHFTHTFFRCSQVGSCAQSWMLNVYLKRKFLKSVRSMIWDIFLLFKKKTLVNLTFWKGGTKLCSKKSVVCKESKSFT